MEQSIRERFEANIDRVRRLVLVYEAVAGRVQGRANVEEADILRAAVVLLHASVDDLLRSLAGRILPVDGSSLKGIRYGEPVGGERASLEELWQHRGMAVEAVIRQSVREHLDRRSFNNLEQVASILKLIGIDRVDEVISQSGADLATMMERRHWIAHRADRNEASGHGQHRTRSLGKATVKAWTDSASGFGSEVLARLGDRVL